MTTTSIIILLAYVIGIVCAFLILRNKDMSTFNKAWWSVFWLPILFWKIVDAIIKGW